MTDLLWILVGSLCPKCVEDGSSGGQEGANADHDQRDNARVAVASAVRHVDFLGREELNATFQIGSLNKMCCLVECNYLIAKNKFFFNLKKLKKIFPQMPSQFFVIFKF